MLHLRVPPDLAIDHNEINVIDKVGVGAVGEVWKAEWQNEIVAVKKFKIVPSQPQILQKFLDELQTMVRTRHPRVLHYYGMSIVSDDEVWVVMEFASGGSLKQFVTKPNNGPTRWFLSLLVTKAVAFLHYKNIIHQAIHSSNFLIVNEELKVSDFGLLTTSEISAHKQPSIRTPWLAPELTIPGHVCTETSDVFSLGMVLWEIMEGRVPYDKITDERRIIRAIQDKMKRPQLPQGWPEAMRNVIAQCWDEVRNRPAAFAVLQVMKENSREPISLQTTSLEYNHKYFEVRSNELVNTITNGGKIESPKIRTLTNPPPFPGADPPPKLPSSVQIITLTPPLAENPPHQLGSRPYDHLLFNRVAEYFHRFYTPKDSTSKVTLDSVDVICNTMLEEQFAHEDVLFETTYSGRNEFHRSAQNDLQRAWLQELEMSENLWKNHKANPISAWHGVSSKHLDSICWYGLLNLSSNDDGYFGKGIYFTQKPSYGEYYANNLKSEVEGEYSLILCWVLLGRPYPFTKVRIGSGLQRDYTSHYVQVKRKQVTREVCETNEDYEMLEGTTTYFPVHGNEIADGDEIVVFKSEQVLPRYIVHYTVTKHNQPQPNIAPSWPQAPQQAQPKAPQSQVVQPQPKVVQPQAAQPRVAQPQGPQSEALYIPSAAKSTGIVAFVKRGGAFAKK